MGFCQGGVLSCGVLSVWGFVLWGFVLYSDWTVQIIFLLTSVKYFISNAGLQGIYTLALPNNVQKCFSLVKNVKYNTRCENRFKNPLLEQILKVCVYLSRQSNYGIP